MDWNSLSEDERQQLVDELLHVFGFSENHVQAVLYDLRRVAEKVEIGGDFHIIAGLNFLKPVASQFDLGFSKVGGTGFSRYCQLNQGCSTSPGHIGLEPGTYRKC